MKNHSKVYLNKSDEGLRWNAARFGQIGAMLRKLCINRSDVVIGLLIIASE